MNEGLEFYKPLKRALTPGELKLLKNRDSVNYDPDPLDKLLDEKVLVLVSLETDCDVKIIRDVFLRDHWIEI